MTIDTAAELVKRLNLTRHPEGGWYRETYRAAENIPVEGLPERFCGERAASTAIYFLLEKGDVSAFHRIRSDELWHFYAGAALTVHILSPGGGYRQIRLGRDLDGGQEFQAVVPAGCWFGAEVSGEGAYALVGCTVAPGFDFADFELADRHELCRQYPPHSDLIDRLQGNVGKGE
jgi:uncharacterized protein